MASIREVLRGNVLILTLGTVIRQLSLFITFPYFSLYIRALGGSNVVVGQVNALRPLAAMFLYPIAGSLADNYGRVKIIVTMNYLSAALHTLFMLAPDWRFLAAASLLNGLTIFMFPATSALLADSLPPQLRGRGFATITAIPGFVGILSPFIGGYLITVYGVTHAMRLLYGVTAAATVLIGTMNLKFLKETLTRPGDTHLSLDQVIRGSYRSVWETLRWMPKGLKFYAIMLVLGLFFNSLTGSYWVVYGTDVIGLSELEWGGILLLANIIQVSLSLPAGALIDRYDKRMTLALALALSALPVFAFPFSGGFLGALLVFTPIAVANAFLIPAASALMADMVPRERRGTVMATLGRGMIFVNYRGGGGGGPAMGFFLTFPAVLGFLIGGYVYDTGPFYPWMLLGVVLAVNTLISVLFIKPSEKQVKYGYKSI
ncbi:MAG: MFS transporter [Candidatus Bathyarchaeia archaeon]